MNISNYKKTGLFFGLSTFLPWLFWAIAGYVSHLDSNSDLIPELTSIIAFIGLFAPVLVALFLAKGNKEIVKDMKRRIFNYKDIKCKYLLISCFLMLGSILSAQAISILYGYNIDQFQLAGSFSFSSGVFPVWFMLIIAPLLEELAWHSYGTDSLRVKFSLFNTSLIFAIFWGIWHFPLSFIKDYYHSNLVEEGLIYSINFIISLIPFVIIMNWIYYKTGRNIILPVIFHITAGYFNEIFNTHPMSKVIQTSLLLAFSIVIIIRDKDFFFNREYNHKEQNNSIYHGDNKKGIFAAVFIIVLFTAGFASKIQAKDVVQTITGKVIDSITNEPLPFASIVILNTDPQIADAADMEGNFSLHNVTVGRYTLKVSMVGYNTYIIKELLVSSGKEICLVIKLEQSDIELEEVVVSTNKTTPLNNMTTLSGKQFTVEETQRYTGGMDDPARLVTAFAGAANPSLSSNGISVRGNSPDGLQWRIEGVEVPTPNHFANLTIAGGGLLSAISSQIMGNSDFYTGAFPAEFGNAYSGVFDIKLREGNRNTREYAFEAGLLGIGAMAQGPFSSNSNATYIANYRYSTMALISPALPSDAGVLKYQDLSYKISIPTVNYGIFDFWGIGAIDGQKMKAADSSDWEEYFDRDDSETSMYMFAAALTNKYIIPGAALLNTTISITGDGMKFKEDRLDYNLISKPQSKAVNSSLRFTIQSELTSKLGENHSNKTGFSFSKFNFNMDVEKSLAEGELPSEIAGNSGSTGFLQFYTQSKIDIGSKLIVNAGINSQYFMLNKNYSVEPRIGLKYMFNNDHSLAFAFGIHSRLEQLPVYFVSENGGLPNKELDFMKSTHFVLSYNTNISENLHLTIEPYYQHLTDVPVEKNGYNSTLNNDNTLFYDKYLVSRGKGRNYGIDFTLEKYLSDGFYYMLTGSIFSSKYTSTDNIERNTKFNKNYLFNIIVGKEWQIGNSNILSANLRINYIGGNRKEPVDYEASSIKGDVVYGETEGNIAFNEKYKDLPIISMALSYRINHSNHSSIWSLQLLNLTGTKEFSHDYYGLNSQNVKSKYEGIVIPSLSYKYEF